jgi:hypothetical protein
MARVASSLVIAIPNGQVTIVVSVGISFSAITLWPEESRSCVDIKSADGDTSEMKGVHLAETVRQDGKNLRWRRTRT